MICKPCALGADILSFYYTSTKIDPRPMAEQLHSDCVGEHQCDCQHSLTLFRGISGD